MIQLPLLLPPGGDWISTSLLDALLLTTIVAPVFWILLIRPLRRVAEFRTEMLARVLEAQESERRRIARDLHDEVGQTLTSLLIGFRTIGEADSLNDVRLQANEFRETTSALLDDIKRLARGLRPSVLDDLGLIPALERLTLDIQRLHDVDVKLETADLSQSRLPSAIEVTVYRIVQEALNNVVKHAEAQLARVRVSLQGDIVEVLVEDDGCGFQKQSTRKLAAEGHFGVAGMTERATLLGGSLAVESNLRAGTRVRARLPMTIDNTLTSNPSGGHA